MCIVRGVEDGVKRNECRAAGPRKRHRLEKGGQFLLRDGICLLLDKMLKAIETEKTGWSLETRYKGMLVDLFKKQALQSLAACVRDCVLVE